MYDCYRSLQNTLFLSVNQYVNLSFQFVELGMVTSIEYNHKPVESARKGQEVCIKIEPVPGEAPKMFGRHFEAKDFLVSKVSTLIILFWMQKEILIRSRRISQLSKSNVVKININNVYDN